VEAALQLPGQEVVIVEPLFKIRSTLSGVFIGIFTVDPVGVFWVEIPLVGGVLVEVVVQVARPLARQEVAWLISIVLFGI
jgi:hypothetical protein